MELFDGEEIQWATKSQDIVLTNYRFRVTTKSAIRLIQSVLLPQILFCSVHFKHYPWLIVFAVLSVAVTASRYVPRDATGLFFVVAIVLFCVYVMTRRTLILITTKGESIEIPLSGKNIAFAVELIDAIEYAVTQQSASDEIAGEATPVGSCLGPRELTQPRPQFPFTEA
jgi:hypothetical protein